MSYKTIAVVGDGVTREWTIPDALFDAASVQVNGAVAVYTQPSWNRVKLASVPAVGDQVTFKVKALTNTDEAGSSGGPVAVDTAALASAVAAQVSASLPSASGVVTGQVVQFKEGQVPAGYAQIGGSAYQPEMAGIFAADSPKLKNGGTDVLRVFSVGGKLFTHQSGAQLQEVDANFKPIGSTVAIAGMAGTYQATFVPLSDGKVLKLGGGTILSTSTALYIWNTDSKTWTVVATGIASIDGVSAQGAQAVNGKVYFSRDGTASNLDEFDPTSWVYTNTFDTMPTTSPRAIIKMPSGKLLFVFSAAQYLFDPTAAAGSRWTQVGSEAVSAGGGVSTATGARYYELGATVNGTTFHLVMRTFTEATGTWVTVNTGVYRPSGAAPGNTPSAPTRGNVLINPYTGATIVRAGGATVGHGAEACYQHYLNYTPAAKVDAIKL